MPVKSFSAYEWDDRYFEVSRFFSRDRSGLTYVSMLLAMPFGFLALFLSQHFDVPDLVQGIGFPFLYGLLAFGFRELFLSQCNLWLRVKWTTWSFWAGRRPGRLPVWTLDDGRFPQARRYVTSKGLSPEELECFEVLSEEFEGSLGELVTLSRTVLAPSSPL